MIVTNTITNERFEIPLNDPKKACLALFMYQVVRKKRRDTVTYEFIDSQIHKYEKSFRHVKEEQKDGSIKFFVSFWSYLAEEGLVKRTPENNN